MSRLRQGDPTVAAGSEFDIIAAVVIGGGSLNGGEGSILGSMIGALIMAFLRNGCQQMGWPNTFRRLLSGPLLLLRLRSIVGDSSLVSDKKGQEKRSHKKGTKSTKKNRSE